MPTRLRAPVACRLACLAVLACAASSPSYAANLLGDTTTPPGWRDHYASLVPNATFASVGVSSPYGNQFADLTGIYGQGKGVLGAVRRNKC